MIAFYYGLTGFACTIYYRRELLSSVKNFFFIGVGPTLGGADPVLPVRQVRHRTLRPGQLRIGQLLVRDRAAAGDRGLLPVLGVVLMFVQWRKVPELLQAQARGRAGRLPRGRSAGAGRPAPRPEGRLMAQIVVGYDGSDCADAALDEALEFAGGLGDRIVVVFGYAPPGIWGGEIAEHEEAIEELGAKVLTRPERGRPSGASRSRLELVAKSGAEALIEVADEARRADDRRRQLRRGAARRAVLGSTPNKLLHIAERPVLVVPAE